MKLWLDIDATPYLPALSRTPWTLTDVDPDVVVVDAQRFDPSHHTAHLIVTLARDLGELEVSLATGAHASLLTPHHPDDLVDELHLLWVCG